MSRCLLSVLFTLIALASGCAQGSVPSATPVPAPPPLSPPATGAASPASPGQNGLILVANVSGKVNQTIEGATTALKVDAAIPAGAKISTGGDASVVLVFSNGAMVTLGADSELVLQEFLQDPFGGTLKLTALQEEPSRSRTVLALNRGELVGNVKRLRFEYGSYFTVQSPVGAMGVRGAPANFRLMFRPSGVGHASFSLSCATGNVVFMQSWSATPEGGGRVTGLSVPAGQEISFEVSVTPNAQGGSVVTTSGPAQPKPVAPAKGP